MPATRPVRSLLAIIAVLFLSTSLRAQSTPPPLDIGWPRVFQKDGTVVHVHQPQIDSWKDHDKLRFRCALEVTLEGDPETKYGVAAVEADTTVFKDDNTVILTNMQVAVRFPSAGQEEAALLSAVVKGILPNHPGLSISLDKITAYLHDSPTPPGVPLNLAPPPIYYSDTPAIMVIFMGQPNFKPIASTGLMFAVNTNWLILLDGPAAQYYLLNNGSWLTTADPINGPWTAASALPDSFSRLPSDSSWDEVRKNMPARPAKVVPRVIVSTQPAELLVTNGPPTYSPIIGTSLMYVTNPVSPIFQDLTSSTYYFLAAGRWFSAPSLFGPWAAASANLPAEFARISHDSPVAYVLPSVPGTQEAKDAVLLASVPEKATVKVSEAKVDVTYQGNPNFAAIDGTTMQYATNSPFEVVLADGTYYCCSKGVWFISNVATGPWSICTSVPAVIYTIPPSCPVYNVTYVRVYSATPTTVVVGYTSGYSGQYVATTGALMFGAGLITGAIIASNHDCCTPCYYSYGCAPMYHYGAYYRSASYYGPHGGAGWGASYNPATGTYARSAYASGPYGSAHATQAYNPWSNTYGAHAGGSSGYGSWGASTVSRGNQWASAAHTTNAQGVTHGWAENSSGQWAQGVHAGNSSLATTSSGDLYAGHDGNAYKKTDDGQWQKYGDGGWNTVNKPQPTSNEWQSRTTTTPAAPQNSWSNQWKSGAQSSDWQSSFENQRSSSSGDSWQSRWQDHDTQSSLNRDSFARDSGSSGFSGFGGGGGLGGGGRFGGGWGGGGGFRRR